MPRVYDDRTNETLFASENTFECVQFIQENFDIESDEEAKYIWID